MRTNPRRTDASPPESAPAGDSASGSGHHRPKRRKALRILAAAVLAVIVLCLASTAVNLLLERQERASITPYGQRVEITGGAVNVYRNGQPGQPIVLLSGLGTAAPALDFAPLIRELGDFDVVVVEGFGYGYSDLSASERSNKNISTELHEVLGKLNIAQPYTLAGHSIAGFYMLDYANRYPAEVAAVIGIDVTVPKATSGPVEVQSGGLGLARLLSVTGVVRDVLAVAPGLAEPDGDAYTPEERERMRLMMSWNFGNQAVADETARIGNNAADLRGISYPDTLPVLAFLADEGSAETAGKAAALENLLKNVKRHEIVPLAGGHYLHWTQSRPMAEAIRNFLATR
ncbi:pimeloyl-ACP methyl ester carboxylesterase [Arthrobacter ginsengisoli]|uniref:Pimeloyl-ACP methyl ester carboxylesterase n=1 Tax=Arthrobacter ginsengisoli TaxID=1356565 RepID=A0ABU1UEM3_9MICC|nr:alpha/beta hydrolase [Arthrobacter ginsengisoli]MDR7083641.1 pimeloyl-ACP methyl ester carboxylesterase [Arthrobacter ginsengisoli]